MHAGPPSALLAHVMRRPLAEAVEVQRRKEPQEPSAEAVEAQRRDGPRATVPQPALLARFSVEILRPVPVVDVRVEVRVVRPGARVALVEGVLNSAEEDRPLMLARAWILRTGAVPVPHTQTDAPPTAGAPRDLPPWWGRGYLDSVEWGWVEGSFEEPGPATVWTRSVVELVAGQPLRPEERVLLVADSGSGISAVASPRDLLFVNTDLTVHLHRAPVGERVWLRSQTVLDPAGVGVTATTLGDEHGSIGQCAQSLYVSARE